MICWELNAVHELPTELQQLDTHPLALAILHMQVVLNASVVYPAATRHVTFKNWLGIDEKSPHQEKNHAEQLHSRFFSV